MPESPNLARSPLHFRRIFSFGSLWLPVFAFVLCQFSTASAHWVAFNDHAPGGGTHAYATRYDVFGGVAPNSGLLKDIASGVNVTATLSIARTASGVAGAQAADNPAQNTLLYNVFHGFVDFAGSPSNSIELTGSGVVTYTVSGLDSSLRYSFRGSAVRGNLAYSDRWTICEIVGTAGFVAAHSSSRVLTSASVSSLTAAQAAINTGINHTADTGDYVGWDNIAPAANGTFSVTCRQYTGTVPDGSSAGTKGYSITGIRIEESPCPIPQGLTILSQPKDQAVIAGGSVTFDVGVAGCPAYYQWLRNGTPVPGGTRASLTISKTTTNDAGSYVAVITNNLGSITSSVVTLSVYSDQSRKLIPLAATWRYNQTGADPGPGWMSIAYNDSAWPSGRGVFARDDSPLVTPLTNTVLSLSNSGVPVIPYFFRTHFNLTNRDVSLTFSNLIDDGAVVWLNGIELFRQNMDAGAVGPTTLASSAAEASFTRVSLAPAFLQMGDNVLAVEVHQAGLATGDVVFGMDVTAVPLSNGPVIIRTSPEAQTITQGDDVRWNVVAFGQAPLSYQWSHNGIDLPGETNAMLGLVSASIERDGFYSVRVTNPFGAVQAVPVRLDVRTPGLVPFYTTDFEGAVDTAWSTSITDITPAGARRFLGQFGSSAVTLTLNNLPPHAGAAVVFDLFIIRSWDGNDSGDIGPDEWTLKVVGGAELLHTTFSNWRVIPQRNTQCFPDRMGAELYNWPLTGASEEKTLGYTHAGNLMDSVYHMAYSFDHSASALALEFAATHLQPIGDESWGLDNVSVYLLPAPPLRLSVPGPVVNGRFTTRVEGLDHQGTVVIEGSSSLLPGSWVPVLTNTSLTGTLDVTERTVKAYRFYRARTD